MRLFTKNRNDLSKYFYDLSKAILIACIAIPFVQGNLKLRYGVAFIIISGILLSLGVLLKEEA